MYLMHLHDGKRKKQEKRGEINEAAGLGVDDANVYHCIAVVNYLIMMLIIIISSSRRYRSAMKLRVNGKKLITSMQEKRKAGRIQQTQEISNR